MSLLMFANSRRSAGRGARGAGRGARGAGRARFNRFKLSYRKRVFGGGKEFICVLINEATTVGVRPRAPWVFA